MTGLVGAGVLLAMLATWYPARPAVRRHRGGGARRSGTDPRDLTVVLVAVAARLRSGQAPARAWTAELGRPVPADGPDLATVLAACGRRRRRRDREADRHRARAVVAACQVAAALGSPLAPVLDAVAEGLRRHDQAEAEVDAALSGPRTSARVVGWLPVAGLALGAAIGARPWSTLTAGGLGTVAGVAGLALFVAGRAWIALLTAAARRAGR